MLPKTVTTRGNNIVLDIILNNVRYMFSVTMDFEIFYDDD